MRLGCALSIVQTNGRPALVRQCDSHYRGLKLKGCELIVFLLDQDDDPCPPGTADLLQAVRNRGDVLLAVMARELEAWLLADHEAVGRVCGRSSPTGHTDSVTDPKSHLRNLLFQSRNRHLSETEMVRSFAPHFSLDRSAQHNASAARFVLRLRQRAAALG